MSQAFANGGECQPHVSIARYRLLQFWSSRIATIQIARTCRLTLPKTAPIPIAPIQIAPNYHPGLDCPKCPRFPLPKLSPFHSDSPKLSRFRLPRVALTLRVPNCSDSDYTESDCSNSYCPDLDCPDSDCYYSNCPESNRPASYFPELPLIRFPRITLILIAPNPNFP